MKIAIVGAGIVGAAAAALLSRQGHQVVLIEAEEPARHASFANGAHLSEGDAETWLSPVKLAKIAARNMLPAPPIRVRLSLDAQLPRFLWLVCRHAAKRPSDLLPRMARRNAQILSAMNAPAHLYHRQSSGILQIFRSRAAMRRATKRRQTAKRIPLSPKECAEIAPGLQVKTLIGGVLFPEDATGDAHLFANYLVRMAEENGAEILTRRAAQKLAVKNGTVRAVITEGGAIEAERIVLALGEKTAGFAWKNLKIRIPIAPAAGYSATLPVRQEAPAPEVGITDPEKRIVISRLDDQIRVAGLVDIGRQARLPDPKRLRQLLRFLHAYAPDAVDFNKPRFWRGFRPMSPDGLPLLGRLPGFSNLFINAGHGHLGWTLALVSADLLGKSLTGDQDEDGLPLKALAPDRFGALVS